MRVTMAVAELDGGRTGCIGFRFGEEMVGLNVVSVLILKDSTNTDKLLNIFHKKTKTFIGTALISYRCNKTKPYDSVFCPSEDTEIGQIIEE